MVTPACAEGQGTWTQVTIKDQDPRPVHDLIDVTIVLAMAFACMKGYQAGRTR